MRNLVIIGGLCAFTIALGILLYVTHPQEAAPSAASATTQQPQARTVSFKVLDQGVDARDMTARKNYAIYDATEFANFWKKAHAGDGKGVPSVDFSKNYVIAVFAGTVPTGGYSISVANVTETGSARSVSVVIEEPGENCTVVEEQTRPYQFVVVPISDADALSHTDVRTRRVCPPPAV